MKPQTQAECEQIWSELRATSLPIGTFKGKAWSYDLPWVETVAASLWRGKVFKKPFDGEAVTTVTNKILGKRMITGDVWLNYNNMVEIDYPDIGLHDLLRPIDITGRTWLGRMALGTSTVWFTLEQE